MFSQSMWCWWKCIALTLIEIVCRLPANVNLSHIVFFPPPVAESNCTFFKFFTTGENTVMFQKTTQKSESEPLSTAVPPYPPTPPSPALPLATSCFSFSISQSLSLSSLCCCLSSPPRCTLSGWPLSDLWVFEVCSAYAVFKYHFTCKSIILRAQGRI